MKTKQGTGFNRKKGRNSQSVRLRRSVSRAQTLTCSAGAVSQLNTHRLAGGISDVKLPMSTPLHTMGREKTERCSSGSLWGEGPVRAFGVRPVQEKSLDSGPKSHLKPMRTQVSLTGSLSVRS